MKTRLIALAAFAIFNFQCSTFNSAKAQRPEGNSEDMAARRAEMVEKRAEKLAKDFELKNDAKKDFIATFKAYQNDLQAVQQGDRQRPERNGERGEGQKEKKLTDEQAKAQVEKYFERQEQQIKRQQERLEVEKKYYEKFKKTLSPQQLARIFTEQRNQRQGGNRPQGGFGPQGGQGPRGGFGGRPEGGFGGDF